MIFKIILGLALFIFGLRLLSLSLRNLANPEWLVSIDNPYAMFLIAIVVTLIVQSSSVTTSLLVVLVSSGQLTLATVIGGIVGANIGTTGTAWATYLITGLERSAFHAAVMHSAFNFSMAIMVLPFARQLANLISRL